MIYSRNLENVHLKIWRQRIIVCIYYKLRSNNKSLLTYICLPYIWSIPTDIRSLDRVVKIYYLLHIGTILQDILKLGQQFMGCDHCLNLDNNSWDVITVST
jgi:hypothetical protein